MRSIDEVLARKQMGPSRAELARLLVVYDGNKSAVAKEINCRRQSVYSIVGRDEHLQLVDEEIK